jgi:hypothetical protein
MNKIAIAVEVPETGVQSKEKRSGGSRKVKGGE